MINRNRLLHRLGRRGIMLSLMGAVYVLLGVGALIRHPAAASTRYNFLYVTPDWVQAALWFITGGLACAMAWRHNDSWGWAGLYVVPFLRVVAYLIAWVLHLIHHDGYPSAWYSAVLYVPFILIVLVCSGWRENYEPPQALRGDEH